MWFNTHGNNVESSILMTGSHSSNIYGIWDMSHFWEYPLVNQHNCDKSPFLPCKSTISMAVFNSKVYQITTWKSTRNAGFNIKNQLFQYLQIVYLPLPSPVHQLTHPRQAQARSFSDSELLKFGGMSFKEQFTFLGLARSSHGRMDFCPPK